MASPYQEAPRPGAQLAVHDTAVTLPAAELLTSPTSVMAESDSTVVLSPKEDQRRRRRQMIRDLKPLGMTGGRIDLIVDLSGYDQAYYDSMQFEEDCFNLVSTRAAKREVVYGPHLLTEVFASSRQALQIEGPLAVPDSMVGRVVKTEHGLALQIRKLIEFKTSHLDSSRKVAGFSNLLAGIRSNPEAAAELVEAVLGGRGGRRINPQLLIAPPNGQIEIDFLAPKHWTRKAIRNMRHDLGDHGFKKINFLSAPRLQTQKDLGSTAA